MRSRRTAVVVTAVLIAATTAGCSTSTVAGSGRRAPCPPVFFGVAGSGEGPQFPAPATVPPGVSRKEARNFGPAIARVKGDLQRIAGPRLALARAVDYPATTAAHWMTLTGLTGLAGSEATGARRLVAAIRRTYRLGCGARPVLLAGYSQGAEVVAAAVRNLPARRQRSVTVALLGNPSYEPGVPGDYPPGGTEAGVRPTLLGGSTVALPPAVRRRTVDICAPGDPVCGVAPEPGGLLGELAYVLTRLPMHGSAYGPAYAARAARFLWRHRVPMR